MFRKKWYIRFLVITSANVDQFSKFFHRQIHKKTPYVPVIEISTSPELRCYNTLQNLKIQDNRWIIELIFLPEKN